jgi:uncharacterized delta-60 repeat protein
MSYTHVSFVFAFVAVGCTDLVGNTAFAPVRDAAVDRADAAVSPLLCPVGVMPVPGRAVATNVSVMLSPGTNLHGIVRDGNASVVAGSSDCPDGCCAMQIARIRDTNGLDTRFGGSGTGIWNYSDLCGAFSAIARTPEGGFVAVGSVRVPSAPTYSGLAVRFSAEGQRDLSFGPRGFATQSAPTASTGQRELFWNGVLADSQGIVVVGADHYNQSSATNGNYARLLADGSLDASFGTGGVTTDARFRSFTAALSDSDGYVLAGESADRVLPALLFLDAGGHPRKATGDNGMVVQARSMVIGAAVRDGLGGVVLGGGMGEGMPGQARLAATRFNPDRTPDTDFGTAGIWVAPVAVQWYYGITLSAGIDVFCDGRVLISGRWGTGLAAFRLTADGHTDEAAGDVGVLDFGDFGSNLSLVVGARVGADQSAVGWVVQGTDGASVHQITIPSQ